MKDSALLKENRSTKKVHSHTKNEQRLIELCRIKSDDAAARLKTSFKGIDKKTAEDRLREEGPNELSHLQTLNFFQDIFGRIKNPLVIQLLAIAIISAVIGEYSASVIVCFMILLSVGLSYILDRRSNSAVESLGKRVQPRTFVIREGEEVEIKTSEVVPGDVIVLQAGSIVPADLRIFTAKDFFVSESSLTGESMPVEKNPDPAPEGIQAALELPNACFMGSSVISGTARAFVVNTGRHTMFGSLSEKLAEKRVETNFDKGIKSFTWLMIRFMIVMVALVFAIVGLTKGNWIEALLFALSVAVGLTPEMLPMIVTVNLAKGALNMAGKKVIVKKLPAIQNLGAINILCTDKTGTLTQDRVVLEEHVDVLGNTSEDVLNYAYLNSFFQTGLHNLLDRAVIEHSDFDVSTCKLIDELPFDFQRRRMSVVVEYEDDHVLICKGAVEEIYSCCTHYQIDDEIYPLIDMVRRDIFEEVEKFNRSGFRVLGLGYREFSKEKTLFTVEDESRLILLGYIAFMDPPKDSALEAIKLLAKTGVQIKVLTGDNNLVTEKVCHDVGINPEKMINGGDLMEMSDEIFSQAVRENVVFVKLNPSQKERIVKELRSQGEIVGFMGDGINDAPALRAADVGISVDSAVDVAKEAADIVLLEKSLLILEDGIIEGRKIFNNIIKYIRMGASSNFGNMFSVVGASYLLPFLPMLPIQILANNLLYDFSQTGIPMDDVDPELTAKPVKWEIGNVRRFMIFIGPLSSIFDYATFGLLWYFYGAHAYFDPALLPTDQEYLVQFFQTGWFVESLLTQTLIVHIIRTRRIPFIQSRASLPMMLTTVGVMLIGVWLPYSPFAKFLGLISLPPTYMLWMLLFLVLYSILTHKVKVWFLKRFEGE
ncbi:MAG: magnesium-translocating P-type ATPase [Leptospirales bacterium]|nr:magnesium-translocating P-type ATPase [Leptospirales bacterium]